MTMMRRREWLHTAAATAGAALATAAPWTTEAGQRKTPGSSYEGKLLRELAPEGTGPSGIGVDADNKTIYWTDDIGGGIAPVCRMKIERV